MTHINKEKYLINCQDGQNNIERATISLILATSASKDHEAVLFLTADASYIAVKGGVNELVHEGMEPMSDLIAQFSANGGKIWLCPICAKLKGISDNDLLDNAQIAGAPKTMEFLANGGKVLA